MISIILFSISSNHLILCHPLFLLPSIFPSLRDFSNESVFHIRWPKYWSFSFSISPSSEYSGIISFRRDWLDIIAFQGLLKSLQHHSINSSVCSFLYVSLSLLLIPCSMLFFISAIVFIHDWAFLYFLVPC